MFFWLFLAVNEVEFHDFFSSRFWLSSHFFVRNLDCEVSAEQPGIVLWVLFGFICEKTTNEVHVWRISGHIIECRTWLIIHKAMTTILLVYARLNKNKKRRKFHFYHEVSLQWIVNLHGKQLSDDAKSNRKQMTWK